MNEIGRKILDIGCWKMLEGPSIAYREQALMGWMRLFGNTRLWKDVGKTFKLAPQEVRIKTWRARADVRSVEYG